MIANPVLRKELLMRLRVKQPLSARVAVIAAIALLLVWIYYQVITALLQDHTAGSAKSAWQVIMTLQFALVTLIAPVIAANAITQEKEQQTWEMLLFTLLTPSEIIFGKLFARLAMLSLLIVLGFPISLFCAVGSLQWGSSGDVVGFWQFLGAYLVTLNAGLFFATFGLFASWKLKRTLYAIMGAYTFVIGFCLIGTMLIAGALTSISGDSRYFENCPTVWVNPAFQLSWVIAPDSNQNFHLLYCFIGCVVYAACTGLMLWRMLVTFRRSTQG